MDGGEEKPSADSWNRRWRRRAMRRKAAAADAPLRLSANDRYSTGVRLLRIGLPALAALLLVAVTLWHDLIPDPKRVGIQASTLPSSAVDSLTMVRPRFDGLDDRGRPYTLLAASAEQEDEEATQISLSQPEADITLETGQWVALAANRGRFDRSNEQLWLSGNVTLFHDLGYELITPEATVALDSGRITGAEGILGFGPLGELEAEGFVFENEGEMLRLTGQSRVLLRPERGEATPWR